MSYSTMDVALNEVRTRYGKQAATPGQPGWSRKMILLLDAWNNRLAKLNSDIEDLQWRLGKFMHWPLFLTDELQ